MRLVPPLQPTKASDSSSASFPGGVERASQPTRRFGRCATTACSHWQRAARCLVIGPLLFALLALTSSAFAQDFDEFVLRHGGVVRGELVRKPAPEDEYVELNLPAGGTITLDRRQVREIRRPSPHLVEYQRQVESMEQSAAAHWELAEWCEQHDLEPQRLLHLYRLIEFEPNHVEARRLLGYVHVQGQWTRPGALRRAEGYERYRGKWRSRQEIQLIEEREAANLAHREWLNRLRRWRKSLASPKPEEVQNAMARLTSIQDFQAIDPLTAMLLSEPHRTVKMLYLQVLAGIEHDRAVHQMVYISLTDPDHEIFHACVDRILPRRLNSTVPTYIKALENDSNMRVNRAAAALKRLGDEAAIEPLIEALMTQHAVALIPKTEARQRGILPSENYQLVRQPIKRLADVDPSQVFQPIRSSHVYDYRWFQNSDVLSALVDLSGVSHGYDQPTWRRWLAARRQFEPVVAPTRRADR